MCQYFVDLCIYLLVIKRKDVKMLKPVRKSAKLFDNVLILLKNELYFVKWMVVGKLRLNLHFVTYKEAYYAVFFSKEGRE